MLATIFTCGVCCGVKPAGISVLEHLQEGSEHCAALQKGAALSEESSSKGKTAAVAEAISAAQRINRIVKCTVQNEVRQ